MDKFCYTCCYSTPDLVDLVCINRDSEHFTDWVGDFDTCDCWKETLEELPAIDAAPVAHGKWKFLNDYESRCSSCGKEIFIDHDDEYRYCPNCGARMDGGEPREAQDNG